MTNQSIKWMNCCFDKLFLNDRIVKSASDGACCVTCKSGFHSSPNVPFQIWGGQGRGQGDGHDFHSSPNAPFQIDHSLPILSWSFSHPPPYGDRSYLQSSLIVSGGAKDWTSQLYQSSWNRLLGNSSLYLSISKEVMYLSLKPNFCHFQFQQENFWTLRNSSYNLDKSKHLRPSFHLFRSAGETGNKRREGEARSKFV